MLILSSKQEWFGNMRGDILAGIVVSLALIPEAIVCSIIAGMISAASGAMALLAVTLVKVHRLLY